MFFNNVQKKNFIISDEVWVLIPARIGSKSIKKKNLQKISGISLLEHAIKTANSCKKIQRVFVSTDFKLIKKIALIKGRKSMDLDKKCIPKTILLIFKFLKIFSAREKTRVYLSTLYI